MVAFQALATPQDHASPWTLNFPPPIAVRQSRHNASQIPRRLRGIVAFMILGIPPIPPTAPKRSIARALAKFLWQHLDPGILQR